MGMMNCRWRSGFACATLLLAVAACDSGEDSAATTAVVTVAVTTIVPSTSTSTAVATTTPAATEVSMTVSPTTVPAVSTSATAAAGDEEAAKAAVIAAAVEAKEAFWAVRQDPTNQHLTDRLQAALDGEAATYQLGLIADGIAAGERTHPHPEVPSAYLVDSDSVVIDLVRGTASLTSCEINSWILVMDAGAGTTPVVLDDLIYRYTGSEEFAWIDDSWLKIGGTQLTGSVWDGTPCES